MYGITSDVKRIKLRFCTRSHIETLSGCHKIAPRGVVLLRTNVSPEMAGKPQALIAERKLKENE
jgi:hypothetical protein